MIFIISGFSIPLGNGVSFRLKRKDQLLDYVLTLMGRDGTDGFADSDLELLHTQVFLLLLITAFQCSGIYCLLPQLIL